ncbi:MAG TPA: hypothetical protein VFS10_21325 [Pyrinomonadaceae bacterium]|nr:hypothetical protein [Pyrinomonadaceae bacterium]
MSKAGIVCAVVLGLAASAASVPKGGAASAAQRRGKQRVAAICPDPTAPCRTSVEFQPHQLPFRVPANAFIFETEQFYAVILKSVRNPADDCTVFIPEAERLAAQELFPHHKVFASRCYDPGELFYSNVAGDQQFMAVYAGRTRAEAARMLARVKATGKYAGANLRRMHTGFNGT